MAPASADAAQPLAGRRDGGVVQAGERLVEQHQPRRVQQRALDRQPLAHAARKGRHRIVAAVREAGARERVLDQRPGIAQRRAAREERQVLGGRQLGIDEEIVAEQADPAAQRRPAVARGVRRRSGRCPDDGLSSVAAIESSVDLPAPFGPSSATISPARQVSETRFSARRRPKLRVTSWKVRLSKSTPCPLRRARATATSSSSAA